MEIIVRKVLRFDLKRTKKEIYEKFDFHLREQKLVYCDVCALYVYGVK